MFIIATGSRSARVRFSSGSFQNARTFGFRRRRQTDLKTARIPKGGARQEFTGRHCFGHGPQELRANGRTSRPLWKPTENRVDSVESLEYKTFFLFLNGRSVNFRAGGGLGAFEFSVFLIDGCPVRLLRIVCTVGERSGPPKIQKIIFQCYSNRDY